VTLAAGLAGIMLLAVSAFGGTSDSAATGLTVDVRRAPGLEPERYTLACDPPTGTVPDPAGACRRIAALVKDATSPSIPRGRIEMWLPGSMVVCQSVYGGPEVMIVRGWLAGHPVYGHYTREDGCAMSGYDRMARILGVPASGAGDEAAATL
jgi:hypothetical protein